MSECHLVDVDCQPQGQNVRVQFMRIDHIRRNRRWAARFQSSDAAVDAVHALYYNTKAALGNDLAHGFAAVVLDSYNAQLGQARRSCNRPSIDGSASGQ